MGQVAGGLRDSTLEPQEELESRTARPCEIQAGFLVLNICSSLCICFFLFLGLPVSTAQKKVAPNLHLHVTRSSHSRRVHLSLFFSLNSNFLTQDICACVCVCVCVCVCSVVSDSVRPYGLKPARLLCPWDFPGKNTGVGCHFLLQGIFPNQN